MPFLYQQYKKKKVRMKRLRLFFFNDTSQFYVLSKFNTISSNYNSQKYKQNQTNKMISSTILVTNKCVDKLQIINNFY